MMPSSSQSFIDRISWAWRAPPTASQASQQEVANESKESDDESVMELSSELQLHGEHADANAKRKARKKEKRLRRKERLRSLGTSDSIVPSSPESERKKKHKRRSSLTTSEVTVEPAQSQKLPPVRETTEDVQGAGAKARGLASAALARLAPELDYGEPEEEAELPQLRPEEEPVEEAPEQALNDDTIRTPSPEPERRAKSSPTKSPATSKKRLRRESEAVESPKKRRQVEHDDVPEDSERVRESSIYSVQLTPNAERHFDPGWSKPTQPSSPTQPPQPKRSHAVPQLNGSSVRTPKKTNGKIPKGSNQKTPKANGNAVPSSTRKARSSQNAPSGKFSDAELRILTQTVEEYRDMHDFSQYHVNDLIQTQTPRGNSSNGVWQLIFERMPTRERQAVIKVCRRKFHNFPVRGTWNDGDEEELMALHERLGAKWTEIGQIMNRHPEDVRDRWRNYTICKGQNKKGPWSEEEEERLKTVVHQVMEKIRSTDPALEESDNLDDRINWNEISKELGHERSRLQCFVKWKGIKEREDSAGETEVRLNTYSWRAELAREECSKMRVGDKYHLLCAIRDSQAGSGAKIPWRSLGDERFRATWSTMARKYAWNQMYGSLRGNDDIKVQDAVSLLAEALEDRCPNQLDDFYQPPPGSARRASSATPKAKPKAKDKMQAKPKDSPKPFTKPAVGARKHLSAAYIDDDDDDDNDDIQKSTSGSAAQRHRAGSDAAHSGSSDMEDIPAQRPDKQTQGVEDGHA